MLSLSWEQVSREALASVLDLTGRPWYSPPAGGDHARPHTRPPACIYCKQEPRLSAPRPLNKAGRKLKQPDAIQPPSKESTEIGEHRSSQLHSSSAQLAVIVLKIYSYCTGEPLFFFLCSSPTSRCCLKSFLRLFTQLCQKQEVQAWRSCLHVPDLPAHLQSFITGDLKSNYATIKITSRNVDI